MRRGGTSHTGRVSQATRKQGNGFAAAALVFGTVGLIVGVVSPPALLLGLVAVVLGAGTWGKGASGPAWRPLA
jgi:hypothetical protein